MELLTAAQMRAIEEAAIASGEVTGLELMERAGKGVVEAIFEEWPELAKTSHRAVVLCGPGNNGGDGFVVARLLKEWGWEVEVFLYGDPEKLPPDARVNYERWGELGEVKDAGAIGRNLSGFDLAVDALLGTGLTRKFDNTAIWGAWHAAKNKAKCVAVDIPTGLCADRRSELGGVHLYSDLTVTFHRPKLGHYVGRDWSRGKLKVKSIGIEPWQKLDELVHLCFPSKRDILSLDKNEDTHKYTHGHALILSGGPGKTGAARLSARGALRIGAGLVTIACPRIALAEVAHQTTAIMCRPLDGAPGLREALEDERLNALCLGPGLGLGADTQALVLEALKATAARGPGSSPGHDSTKQESAAPAPEPGPQHMGSELGQEAGLRLGEGPGSGPGQDSANQEGAAPAPEPGPPAPRKGDRGVVLDADALTRFERNPQALFDLLHEHCVLTPHAGEFKRLFPDIAEKLDAPAETGPAYSKVDATREAAARAGCTILFKGPDTVIANQTGRCAVNASAYERAAPWLATAGSGDVLAGFITGLLARGFGPMQAAETAAWLHTECALSFGPGLIAEDIPEELPKVFKALL